MTEADFFRLTFRQLDHLLKRHKQHIERERTLVASLQAVIINFSMCRPKEPVTVDDLLGKPKPEMTDDEFAESFAAAWKYRSHMIAHPTKE